MKPECQGDKQESLPIAIRGVVKLIGQVLQPFMEVHVQFDSTMGCNSEAVLVIFWEMY